MDCPVQRGRRAVFEWQNRSRIGHDTYFFSSVAARNRFQKDPLRWCGKLTDPVTQVRFRPTSRSPRVGFNGREYYFVSLQSRATFQNKPAMYADPKRTMPPAAPR